MLQKTNTLQSGMQFFFNEFNNITKVTQYNSSLKVTVQ